MSPLPRAMQSAPSRMTLPSSLLTLAPLPRSPIYYTHPLSPSQLPRPSLHSLYLQLHESLRALLLLPAELRVVDAMILL